jgi:hypothetical protein
VLPEHKKEKKTGKEQAIPKPYFQEEKSTADKLGGE